MTYTKPPRTINANIWRINECKKNGFENSFHPEILLQIIYLRNQRIKIIEQKATIDKKISKKKVEMSKYSQKKNKYERKMNDNQNHPKNVCHFIKS